MCYLNSLRVDNHKPGKRDANLATSPGWGDRLVKVREYRGMSQTDLIKATGLSAPTVWRHEQGRTPRESVIEVYERVLKVDRYYLLHGEPQGTPPWGVDDALPPERPGPPHAELWAQYFQNEMGRDTPADLRPVLEAFLFASLGIAVPTLSHAHQVRMIAQSARVTS